jgi:hypothetical protein
MARKQNLRIHELQGDETQTKGIENLLKEIIAEISQNLGKDMDIKL